VEDVGTGVDAANRNFPGPARKKEGPPSLTHRALNKKSELREEGEPNAGGKIGTFWQGPEERE